MGVPRQAATPPSGSPAQLQKDCLSHPFKIPHHLVIPKTQDFESLRFNPCSPRCVLGLAFRVLPAIQFHHEPSFETHKIQDVASQRMLAAELETVHLTLPKIAPKQALGISGLASQAPSISFG
jgi:hypothetical protein